MKDKNLTILVASHKPDRVYHDDVYTPIHVGRAISKFKNEMADIDNLKQSLLLLI